MLIEGYYQLDPLDFGVPVDDMLRLMDRLHEASIPLAFCFVFDEFWKVFLKLHFAIEVVLGRDYLRLPDFWSWRIDPVTEGRGWKPHRDKSGDVLFEDGSPKSISVWVALTEATTLNGCMYILPADRDPSYRNSSVDLFATPWASFIDGFRALPVPAGTAIIWNQHVWHYGSRSSKRGSSPRYSLAVEFQKSRIAPFNHPISSSLYIPGFDERLALIGKQVFQYQHMYPLTEEVKSIVLDLLS